MTIIPARLSQATGFLTYISLGKTIREGMGQATNRPASETLDLVITNALIIDWSGIYKVTQVHVVVNHTINSFSGGHRCKRRLYCRNWQSRQSRHHA